jgi:hypothetical protein
MKFSYRGLIHSALPERNSEDHSGREARGHFGEVFL